MYGSKLSESPDTVAIVAAIYGLGDAMRREKTPVSLLVVQARTLLEEVERQVVKEPPVIRTPIEVVSVDCPVCHKVHLLPPCQAPEGYTGPGADGI